MARNDQPDVKTPTIITTRKVTITRHRLSASQRAALRKAGHKDLATISVVTNRRDGSSTDGTDEDPTAIRRRSVLNAEQRSALRRSGHGNVRAIVTKRRRTEKDGASSSSSSASSSSPSSSSSSSYETRHTLSEEQRAALRDAGRGNLRRIVVKGTGS
ncbi:hypothetical protein DHEL01_v203317 [Diaporthe helianthi]|uniref:Uncharacterized protein n=1 Tax=Diaporthe helianthi TaxID=158607 RepID=A0A2P5I740_DIAHE|nr:hypothetical protein DHEL01_v203317 [Diaporthe helianthi]